MLPKLNSDTKQKLKSLPTAIRCRDGFLKVSRVREADWKERIPEIDDSLPSDRKIWFLSTGEPLNWDKGKKDREVIRIEDNLENENPYSKAYPLYIEAQEKYFSYMNDIPSDILYQPEIEMRGETIEEAIIRGIKITICPACNTLSGGYSGESHRIDKMYRMPPWHAQRIKKQLLSRGGGSPSGCNDSGCLPGEGGGGQGPALGGGTVENI